MKEKLLPNNISGRSKELVACYNASMKKLESHKRKRITRGTKQDNNGDEVRSTVLNRAQEVQANLSPEFPSMTKYMLHSHVTRGFWLGLPTRFCDEYLPKENTMMELVDENEKSFEAKYLAVKKGLSGGWRGFSVAHNISEGDAVVFQLVKPTTIKVYIVRVNGHDEVDGALGLLELDNCSKPTSSDQATSASTPMGDMEDQSSKEDIDNGNVANNENNLELVSDQSEHENGDLGFEIYDGIRMAEAVINFKDIKSFEDFDIIANGLVLNSELSKHLQSKYYELCCSQKSFLHDHMLEGLNCKLASGVIAETTNIADAIRAANLTTPQENFATWKKTLKAFETLGMKVSFLITRLEKLMTISAKHDRLKQATHERVDAKMEKQKLEAKLMEVKQTIERLNYEISKIETSNSKSLEIMFHEIAQAPW